MHFSLFGSKLQAGVLGVALAAFSMSPAFSEAIAQSNTKNWSGVVRLVAAGDEIILDPTTLKAPGSIVSIEWREGLSGRKADYLHTAAAIDSAGVSEVLSVFIQRDRAEKFLAKCGIGHDHRCTMKVGKDFQYGQSKTGSVRFLVYHDKTSKPYSRRFLGPKTAPHFLKTGKKLIAELDRKELLTSARFTASQYLPRTVSKVFRSDQDLRDISAGSTTDASMRILGRLSPEKKIAFIARKSRWCFDQTNQIFGKRGPLSDGSWSDPGKLYTERCLRWEHRAWLTMVGSPNSGTMPADLGKPGVRWRHCLAKVEREHGHRGKEELKRRATAEYDCEVKRKLELLAIGADPGSNYMFSSDGSLKKFFASGTWRLKK